MKTQILSTVILFLFFITDNVMAQSQLWAVTRNGGTGNQGALIHANSNGTGFTVAHSFHSPAGFYPYGDLLQASDGNLYGTCYLGGSTGSCTIYRFNPSSGVYTDIYSFVIQYGNLPTSGVIQAPNGKLYGASSAGGNQGKGVIYSYDLNTNTYSVLFNFNGTNGSAPYGNPILHTNGKLYGLTSTGGTTNHGIIYSFDISNNTFTKLHSFDGTNGAGPKASLLQLINGRLYGMTRVGGINNAGVLFSFDPANNIYAKLFDFNTADGTNPEGSLYQASNGWLYGMTSMGGANNHGVIFRYSVAAGSYAKLYSFIQADGITPLGKLTQSGSLLCGTTSEGGSVNKGVMFNFNITNNTYAKVLDFNGTNGANPNGGFIQVTTTGIDQNTAGNENISVFPNPAMNELNITFPANQHGITTYNLHDISGNLIYSSFENIVGNSSRTIDLTGMSPGAYFLIIDTEKEKITRKVIKQ